MQGSGMLFFIVFGVIQVGMYVVIRRQLTNPTVAAAGGTIASVVAMTLSLQGNEDVSNIQALILGFVIAVIFSVATLAVAWYFHSSELREKYADSGE